jgi:hypothetical protein
VTTAVTLAAVYLHDSFLSRRLFYTAASLPEQNAYNNIAPRFAFEFFLWKNPKLKIVPFEPSTRRFPEG